MELIYGLESEMKMACHILEPVAPQLCSDILLELCGGCNTCYDYVCSACLAPLFVRKNWLETIRNYNICVA